MRPDSEDAPDLETHPFQYLKYYRWMANFWFIGLPYLSFCIIANIWNLWFNLKFNYFWAGANLFLLLNTFYGFMQSFYSVLIVLEIPVWLKHGKDTRMKSLNLAAVWNFAFILFAMRARRTLKTA